MPLTKGKMGLGMRKCHDSRVMVYKTICSNYVTAIEGSHSDVTKR